MLWEVLERGNKYQLRTVRYTWHCLVVKGKPDPRFYVYFVWMKCVKYQEKSRFNEIYGQQILMDIFLGKIEDMKLKTMSLRSGDFLELRQCYCLEKKRWWSLLIWENLNENISHSCSIYRVSRLRDLEETLVYTFCFGKRDLVLV